MDIRVKLAQTVTEEFVRRRRETALPAYLPVELAQQRACYVYIYVKPGQHLKAVCGYPLPRQKTLAEEIRENTVQAISGPRYLFIKKADLGSLMYSVAVLDPLQRVSDLTHLQPQKFGLYLRSEAGRWAVVMPQRPGVETPQDQLATALREASVSQRRASYIMYRFGVGYYE